MIELEVRLYGSFRDYSDSNSLRVELEEGAGLDDLRACLQRRLQQLRPEVETQDLLEKSVFADQNDILPAEQRLYSSQLLSIIPPVCGG